ncbi:MAG: lipid-A-disaccharide synthase [Spirochaetia bacterium]|nr:lipid-A-disaccharide synthase [Spirochaetia bacterium]
MKKSILIVAGETSGDNLASAIIEEWRKLESDRIDFWGFGGQKMQKAGVHIIRSTEDLAVVGLWEGLVNYRRLSSYLESLVGEAKKRKIEGAILIDYPGFNLKLAQHLYSLNIPVYLVVSPQIWAWHYSRVKKIRKYIATVFCLYQFETEIYAKENIQAVFIGHPMVQKIRAFLKSHSAALKKEKSKADKYKKIALLPGSRLSEITRHLPFLLEVAALYHRAHPETIFEIPAASEEMAQILAQSHLPDYISVQTENSYRTLATCDAGIVCSGTATLECALFNMPFLLIYKTSWFTYFLGKRLIRLPYIGLVNIIANRFITKEFIQSDMKIQPVLAELEKLACDSRYIKEMKSAFQEVQKSVESENSAKVCATLLSRIFS